jgi:hypothetical protein
VTCSVILSFLNHFVRCRGGGGRGASGRGAGYRRMRPLPAGRHGAEEAVASTGEAMGGGGRGSVTSRVLETLIKVISN